LQRVTNEHDEFAAVGDGIATITETIFYFTKFEPLFFEGELGVAQNLKSAVIDVYSDILKFLSKAKSYYDERATHRLSPHSLAPASDASGIKIYDLAKRMTRASCQERFPFSNQL
jgi:hypothetical protein